MSCEHLICAQCAGPVAEGRCSTCRAAREQLHHSHPNLGHQLLIAGLGLLIFTLVLLLAAHLIG